MTTFFFIFGHLEAVETTLIISFEVGTNAGPFLTWCPLFTINMSLCVMVPPCIHLVAF